MADNQLNVDEAVAIFVEIRDIVRTMDAQYEEKVKPYKAKLEQVKGLLQEHLDKTGAQSIRTKFGTCYTNVKYSASVSDREIFKKFVVDTRQFDLLDVKANLTVVKDFVKVNNGALPPGCNLSSHKDVGVRRPNGDASAD